MTTPTHDPSITLRRGAATCQHELKHIADNRWQCERCRRTGTMVEGMIRWDASVEQIEYCTSVPACALSSEQLAELRKWWDAFGAENTPAAVLKMVNELLELRRELAALQAFKTYVHQRLDEAGIPTHPDGKHSREGCRVGDRLDILVERATAKPFDDATLRAIQERAAKATKRPWIHKIYDVHGDNHHAIETEDGSELGQAWGDDNVPECWPVTANGEFIAHSREDIDTLLAALRSRGVEGEPHQQCWELRAADKVAIAAFAMIERGAVPTRSPLSDALEVYADNRFDVMDGSGIAKLREVAEGKREWPDAKKVVPNG